jgi:SAM-dependent methyltransferase
MGSADDALTNADVWDESWGKEDLDLENATTEFSDPIELDVLGVLESYIDFRTQPRMIELGGAHSVNLLRFSMLGATATAIDFSHVGLVHTKGLFILHNKLVDLIEADIFNLPFSSATKFDFVYSIGLCEHFIGGLRQSVFAVHKQLIRQGGLSLIAVPNVCSPIYQLWYTASWLLQVVPSIGRRLGVNIVSERAFSRRELVNLTSVAGFKTIQIISSCFIYDAYFWIWVSVKKFIARLLNIRLNLNVPSRYYQKTFLDPLFGTRHYIILTT